MKKFSEYLLEKEYCVNQDSAINEMANLGKNTTKLPLIVYISDKRGVNHGPRIKVNMSYGNSWSGNSFTVTIDKNPKVIGKTTKINTDDLNDVIDWVKLNCESLLDYWNEAIDISEFLSDMKHI